MNDTTWGAPFLAFLVVPLVRFARWLRRVPRCPYCSALIPSRAVMCRRCAHPHAAVIDVSFADLLGDGDHDDAPEASGEAEPTHHSGR